MNRSKIGFCDHTWNPITGCRDGCENCYARRISVRFSGNVRLNKMAKKDYSMVSAADGGEDLYVLDTPMLNETGNSLVYPFGFAPTLHRYRMSIPEKLKMGNNILVGAMGDIFGEWVPDSWLNEVFEVCKKYSIHNYLFLTRNSERYKQYNVPCGMENMWYGITITKEEDIDQIANLPFDSKKFVSIGSLVGDIQPERNWMLFRQIDWILIEAEIKRGKEIVSEWSWIKRIIDKADQNGVPVFMEDSLLTIVGEKNMRREFPQQLQKSELSPKMKKKLYDSCASCKAHLKKSEMITLFARSKRGEQPKQFGFMCKECFKKFCKNTGINIPELIELTENAVLGDGRNG